MVSAVKCVYKKDKDSENIAYTPDEVRAYKIIGGKYYESKFIGKQLFLEYLINGIVDIYFYRDINGGHYYIEDGIGELYELNDEQKELLKNDVRYVVNSKEYVGVLKSVFKDSPQVQQKVDYIPLNHKSLIKITNEYHNQVCYDKECIIYEKKIKRKVLLVVFLVLT